MSTAAPAPPPSSAATPHLSHLSNRRIAFTTPTTYSPRLDRLIRLDGAIPLPIPTITLTPTPASLTPFLQPRSLDPFSALAFTSRSGISAFSAALSSALSSSPLSESGDLFTIAALGKDADLLYDSGLLSRICHNTTRVRILVPEIASPSGLVAALGDGSGRKVLCPVPAVVGLKEPDVVPTFLADLRRCGWEAVRVDAYETRWAGTGCAEGLVGLDGEVLDAVVFTSTAEVEGLLKGLDAVGWSWDRVREKWPEMVSAAHGPVTADGARGLGVTVDVVGAKFGSFDGVLEALDSRWSD